MTGPQEHAGGGGAAGQPTPLAGGPTPAQLPDEIRAALPEGFELPPGFLIVEVPEPTPAERVAGAVEHASMLRGLADAAAADLEELRVHAEGQLAAQAEGAARVGAQADEAERAARDLAAELGVDLAAGLPRHDVFAFLDTGPAGEGGDR